jgi:hypothetical protein
VHQPLLKVVSVVVSRFLHVLVAAASVFALLGVAFR